MLNHFIKKSSNITNHEIMNTLKLFLLAYLSILPTYGCEKVYENPAKKRYTKMTVQYKTPVNTNKNLLSLDLYYFKNHSSLKPIVIYVHGGGWCIGDKASQISNKVNLFAKSGYIFVSVNYRLSPYPYRAGTPDRIMYPDHNNDIADAIKWIYDNIHRYGGDKSRIALLGHSAGAHLVSLMGTNERFLESKSLPLSLIKGVASIDTKGYDVFNEVRNSENRMMYINAFGTKSSQNWDASPAYNLKGEKYHPKFFIALRGSKERKNASFQFIDKLEKAGFEVVSVDGSRYNHKEINEAIGSIDDTIVTPALIRFFEECFR